MSKPTVREEMLTGSRLLGFDLAVSLIEQSLNGYIVGFIIEDDATGIQIVPHHGVDHVRLARYLADADWQSIVAMVDPNHEMR